MKSSKYTLTMRAEVDLDKFYEKPLEQYGPIQTNKFLADLKTSTNHFVQRDKCGPAVLPIPLDGGPSHRQGAGIFDPDVDLVLSPLSRGLNERLQGRPNWHGRLWLT